MQTIDKFNDNLGTAILLVGGAGSGKTVLAMRLYPKTYVFVTDLNFKSGIDYLKKKGLTQNIVGFNSSFQDEVGVKIPPNKRYDWMMQCFTKAIESKDVDCIVIDSWSFVEEIIKVRVNKATTEVTRFEGKDTFALWGDLLVTTKSMILQFRQSGKKIVVTTHEKKDLDESDKIYKYQIDLDGAMKNQFPKFMSDVWRCEVIENLGKHTWNLRMLSNARQEHLKRSSAFSDLPAVISQDDIVKHLGQPTRTPSAVT